MQCGCGLKAPFCSFMGYTPRRWRCSPHKILAGILKASKSSPSGQCLLFQRATGLGQGQPFLGQVSPGTRGSSHKGVSSLRRQVHWKSKEGIRPSGRSLRASKLASSSSSAVIKLGQNTSGNTGRLSYPIITC